ncbi:MAG: LEPR-XLL domain-containing protein, partial [Pirellulaceae bacterium]
MRFSDWLNPLRQPTRRSRNQHRRPRVAALFETLEDRVMLSGVTGVDYHQVDADWFASLGHKNPPNTSAGPSGAYGHGQGNSAGDFTAATNRWIVRLTSDAVATAPGVHNVQCVLDTGAYPLEVVRGLGLPGQVLVNSGDAGSDQVRQLLSGHPLVSSFEADLGVAGQEIPPNDPLFTDQIGLNNT